MYSVSECLEFIVANRGSLLMETDTDNRQVIIGIIVKKMPEHQLLSRRVVICDREVSADKLNIFARQIIKACRELESELRTK